MRFRLSDLERRNAPPQVLDLDTDDAPKTAPLVLDETSKLVLRWYPTPVCELRVEIGNVIVASTLDVDMADHPIELDLDDNDRQYLRCKGKLLEDWIGQTQIRVLRSEDGDVWETVFEAELYVAPKKIGQDEFEDLCQRIADESASLLLDIYSKTFVGLQPERRLGESGPIAAIDRLAHTCHQLKTALRGIAKRPAFRLAPTSYTAPRLGVDAVTQEQLEAVSLNPNLVRKSGRRVQFIESVHQDSSRRFDLAENITISEFINFLALQARDLLRRIHREIELRKERRMTRHRVLADGKKSMWERVDQPRIRVLERLNKRLQKIEADVGRLRKYEPVSTTRCLAHVPKSTPLFLKSSSYRSAFKTIRGHLTSYRVSLDDQNLLVKAKNISTLFEWWCLLEVIGGTSYDPEHGVRAGVPVFAISATLRFKR